MVTNFSFLSFAQKKYMQVVLSPGPGNPTDFALSKSIELLMKHQIPGFGVCLGLQGMVEHFGGTLGVLSYPMHGKPSEIALTRHGLAENRYVCLCVGVCLFSGTLLVAVTLLVVSSMFFSIFLKLI